MGVPSWGELFRLRYWLRVWPWIFLVGVFSLVRFSKGAGFSDAYAFLSRPFWPGSAQGEWVQKGIQIEHLARINLLEQDNKRLREMLSLQRSSGREFLSAAVISRTVQGWWHQLVLAKGERHGIDRGNPVMGPGGLIGLIESVTPTTSRVRLLTSPGSRVGVWAPRTKRHGILIGIGTNRPQLQFLDKDSKAIPGDLVSTSPASTLLPPNVPIGIIQSVDTEALPAPEAVVQLTAAPEAIDWVQVQMN